MPIHRWSHLGGAKKRRSTHLFANSDHQKESEGDGMFTDLRTCPAPPAPPHTHRTKQHRQEGGEVSRYTARTPPISNQNQLQDETHLLRSEDDLVPAIFSHRLVGVGHVWNKRKFYAFDKLFLFSDVQTLFPSTLNLDTFLFISNLKLCQ